ncbi:MAG: tRNA pseudouridine synthase A [Candidatus Sericytochromatia bacterium]|nr:MAG: tRNA pseudouridine synthase A [Candidatus Sericytochromatia bacterium]
MNNICLILEYEGKNYNGFQKQKSLNIKTIQGELENAIFKLTNEKIKTIGAGRTDAGVNAEKQFVNFFSNSNIPPEKFSLALNNLLPKDISVKRSFLVPNNFHARYSAISRKYKYRILVDKNRSSLRRNLVFHCPFYLNFEIMKNEWLSIVGKHDFTAFCKSETNRKNMECNIIETTIDKKDDEIILTIKADTFLRGMVRLLVGTLLSISQEKTNKTLIEFIKNKEKNKFIFSAPPEGLSLVDVEYPKEFGIFIL